MNARQKAKHYKKLLDKTYELMKKKPVVISRYRPRTICFRRIFPLEANISKEDMANIVEKGIAQALAKEIGKYAELQTEINHVDNTLEVFCSLKVMAREEL